jgi:hypothetical protein
LVAVNDPDVFVVAASSRVAHNRAVRTVVHGLPVAALKRVVTDPRTNEFVDGATRKGVVRLWSIRDSSGPLRHWERIRPGDWLLFFDRGFIAIAATVADRLESPELSAAVWGGHEQEGLSHFVAFDSVTRVRAPVTGYKSELGARFLGFRRLADSRLSNIRETYGSTGEFIDTAILRFPYPGKK